MIKEDKINIAGMSCANCELRIERAVKKVKGVINVKANFQTETAFIKYDTSKTTMSHLEEVIQKAGYKVDKSEKSKGNRKLGLRIKKDNAQFIGLLIVIFSVYLIVSNTVGLNFIPSISANMGYGMLFTAGLFTSIHCIAMCGGLNISQSITIEGVDNRNVIDKLTPGLMYNSGRIVSYTILGGLVGGVGSVVALTGAFKGVVAIISGVLMLLMGLNMAGIKVKYIRFDFINKILVQRMFKGKHNYNRFYVGLLNGLMPCGPLQAMQLYALGTGSIITGALSMLAFGLGTFPLLITFSIFSTVIGKRFAGKMVKASAALVIVLSFVMVSNGLALSGVVIGGGILDKSSSSIVDSGKQVVKSSFSSGRYEAIKVKKGIPVKWIIHMDKQNINGCNETLVIPEYNIEKKLTEGDNIIEFNPDKTGTLGYSCWMGMIRSTITVEN